MKEEKNSNFFHLLKQNNRILNVIRCNSNLDKTMLGKLLDVSWPTVSKNIDELRKLGIILESELNISKNAFTCIGISIGSAQTKLCFLHADFSIFSSNEFEPYQNMILKSLSSNIKIVNTPGKSYLYFNTPNSLYELKNVLDSIFESLKEIVLDNQANLNIISIGISCTGIVNKKEQKIEQSYGLPWLNGNTLDDIIIEDKKAFFTEHGICLFLEQNSTAASVAEKYYLYFADSPYKMRKNIAVIYLGGGWGAALIFNNQLYYGSRSSSAEIGHMPCPTLYNHIGDKDEKELKCTCGNSNCFELQVRQNVFNKTFDEFRMMNSQDIYNFLIENEESKKLLGNYMGTLVNVLTNLLNLDLVIFTGKINRSMDILHKDISLIRDENKLSFIRSDCSVISSKIGALSPTIGAAICGYYAKIDSSIDWN